MEPSSTPAHPRVMRGNLFDGGPAPAGGERFDPLLDLRNLLIERITSSADAPSSTYVQEQDEWVVLMRGEATLVVDGERLELSAGDHVFLPARTPHTVERTSEGALWLAVHLR